ncbi:MAG: hypothetical protein AAFY88_32085, partial [Acidobacteriota bacterium]
MRVWKTPGKGYRGFALALGLGLLAGPVQGLEIDDFSFGDEPIINNGTYETGASNSLGGTVDFRLER